jgi:glutaredoxin
MEARRCATHGLVVDENGRCVICKRGEVATQAKTSSDLPVVILLVVMAVLTVGALGYWATRKISGLVATSEPPPPTEPAPPADNTQAAATPDPAPRPKRSDDFPSISTSEPTATVTPEELSDEEVERLKRGVKVTMYARSNCSLCDQARTFLRSRRYQLTELDVEASPTDKVVLESLNPAGTMPTFVVDGKTIVGYDRTVLDEAIEKAAMRKANR